MNGPTKRCDDFRIDLAGLILGGLESAEEANLRAHLLDCSSCRQEHDQLADTPQLLNLRDRATQEAPSRIRDRVLSQAVRQQVQRRWRWISVAAAVGAALVAAVAGWQLGSASTEELQIAIPLQNVEPFAASGHIILTPRAEELAVTLEIQGLETLPEPQVYEAWLSTEDQSIISIGQLRHDPDGAATVTLDAPGTLSDYRYFWLTAEPDDQDPGHSGPTVVQAIVPSLR